MHEWIHTMSFPGFWGLPLVSCYKKYEYIVRAESPKFYDDLDLTPEKPAEMWSCGTFQYLHSISTLGPQVIWAEHPSSGGKQATSPGAPCFRSSSWAFLGPEVSSGPGKSSRNLRRDARFTALHSEIFFGNVLQTCSKFGWYGTKKQFSLGQFIISHQGNHTEPLSTTLPLLWMFGISVTSFVTTVWLTTKIMPCCSPESEKCQHSSTWGSCPQCFPPPRLFQP